MASDPTDALLDQLVGQLTPVRRRTTARDGMILAGLGVVEILIYLVVRGIRPDMPQAMDHMAFWWKAASLVVMALVAGATALAALDPARSPRPGLRGIAIVAAVAVAIGWGIDAASVGGAALAARLDWPEGLRCVGAVIVLSLPPLLGFAVLMRRGAPTDLGGTASAAGLAAAASGGAVFVLACPHDDPLYVALWFAVGIALVAGVARIALPRLARW